jgi:hypothetical protein
LPPWLDRPPVYCLNTLAADEAAPILPAGSPPSGEGCGDDFGEFEWFTTAADPAGRWYLIPPGTP